MGVGWARRRRGVERSRSATKYVANPDRINSVDSWIRAGLDFCLRRVLGGGSAGAWRGLRTVFRFWDDTAYAATQARIKGSLRSQMIYVDLII